MIGWGRSSSIVFFGVRGALTEPYLETKRAACAMHCETAVDMPVGGIGAVEGWAGTPAW